MAFPTTLDTFVNPSGSSTTDNPSLSAAVTNAGNGVETLMIKVGIDSSAVTTSHDYKLSNVTGSYKAASVTGAETLTSKTLFTPVIDAGLILNSLDMDGKELILDGDADTSIHADTDNQIDIKIAGADDFQFTTNLFAALPGSSIRTPSATAFKSRNNADGANIDLIAANSLDQTIIGQNSVRATRFVYIDPAVEVLSVNPNDTNFTHDVDVTAQTSATTFAIAGRVSFRASSAGIAAYIRPNGSSQGIDDETSIIRNQNANSIIRSSFIVGTDTSQIFEWAVGSTLADLFRIAVTGYWEYVDG